MAEVAVLVVAVQVAMSKRQIIPSLPVLPTALLSALAVPEQPPARWTVVPPETHQALPSAVWESLQTVVALA